MTHFQECVNSYAFKMHEPQKGIHESENEQDAIMFMMITTKLMLLLKDLSDMIFNRNIFVACDVFISVS